MKQRSCFESKILFFFSMPITSSPISQSSWNTLINFLVSDLTLLPFPNNPSPLFSFWFLAKNKLALGSELNHYPKIFESNAMFLTSPPNALVIIKSIRFSAVNYLQYFMALSLRIKEDLSQGALGRKIYWELLSGSFFCRLAERQLASLGCEFGIYHS